MIELDNWTVFALKSNAKLSDAVLKLEVNTPKILLITNESGNLLGTLTDGDIRRALISGKKLDEMVSVAMNCSPVTATIDASESKKIALLNDNAILALPVLFKDGRVAQLFSSIAKSEKPQFNNSIIVMAGGLGSRLWPLTKDCPKPMIKINGKPILEHIVINAKAAGFENFIFSINHLGNVIKEHFGNGHAFGANIEYIEETKRLGTAGSLSLIKKKPTHPVVVCNGDVITKLNLKTLLNFHNENSADATMAIKEHLIENPYGEVLLDGVKIIGFNEKPFYPSIVNTGVYVLSPVVWDFMEYNSKLDMPDLFEKLRKNSKSIVAFMVHEQWTEVGVPADII